jgi:hypothetical protein
MVVTTHTACRDGLTRNQIHSGETNEPAGNGGLFRY